MDGEGSMQLLGSPAGSLKVHLRIGLYTSLDGLAIGCVRGLMWRVIRECRNAPLTGTVSMGVALNWADLRLPHLD
jgi:hypothetical protein